MRYTEKKYDFIIDTKTDIIRMIFCSIFLSPYRLFKEISSKICFLDRKKFDKFLFISCIISFIVLIITVAYNYFFSVHWIDGGNAIITSCVSCAVVILLFVLSKPFSLLLCDLSSSLEEAISSKLDEEELEMEPNVSDNEINEDDVEVEGLNDIFSDEDELDDDISEFTNALKENDLNKDIIMNTLESRNTSSNFIKSKFKIEDKDLKNDESDEDEFGINAFLESFEDILEEDDDSLYASIDNLY